MYVLKSGFLASLVVCLGFPSLGPSQRQQEETLAQRVARLAQLKEAEAERALRAIGPAIREELVKGRQVAIAGLGTFRVVRIEAHKDLREGRPVVIPATNTIEFLADNVVIDSANAATAEPAATVPEFKFIPLATQTPGQKVGRGRAPVSRTR